MRAAYALLASGAVLGCGSGGADVASLRRLLFSAVCSFFGPTSSKDVDDDLAKAMELSRVHRPVAGGRPTQEPDRAAQRELQEELLRARESKRGKSYLKF